MVGWTKSGRVIGRGNSNLAVRLVFLDLGMNSVARVPLPVGSLVILAGEEKETDEVSTD